METKAMGTTQPTTQLRPKTKHPQTKIASWIIASACCLLTACGGEVPLYRFAMVEDAMWDASEVLTLPLDTVRQTGQYVSRIAVRKAARPQYPYQDVTLEVRWLINGQPTTNDTVRIPLYNAKPVRTQHGLTLETFSASLPEKVLYAGQYGTLRIRHLMRLHILPGIADVGVCVEKR